MSGQDVEFVRRVFEAYNGEDIDALLRMHAPDVVLRRHGSPSTLPRLRTEYRGHEGLKQSYEDVNPTINRPVMRAEEFEDLGDGRVLVRGVAGIVGRPVAMASGQRVVWVVGVRGESVASIDLYADLDDPTIRGATD